MLFYITLIPEPLFNFLTNSSIAMALPSIKVLIYCCCGFGVYRYTFARSFVI